MVERRIIPALPEQDEVMGRIAWERWEPALSISHIDPSCETCAFPGPLSTAFGMTEHQPPPRRKLLRRSDVANGVRPQWGPPLHVDPHPLRTHYAVRCPACDEMTVWVAHCLTPRCSGCGGVSEGAVSGEESHCTRCLALHEHWASRGMQDRPVVMFYRPPTTERVPAARSRRPVPQEDSLF